MRLMSLPALAVALFCVAIAHSSNAADALLRVKSDADVPQSVARLTEAAEAAGAKVFIVIDHQAGATSVDIPLRPTTLVLFGNPKIGSPAMVEAQTMGLEVPLRVLVFEDEAGDVWLAYENPADQATRRGVRADNPSIVKMQGALAKLTAAGAGQ